MTAWERSCRWNARLGGDPDMPICARVFFRRRLVRFLIDVAMLVMPSRRWRERGHCERVFFDYLSGR